MTLAGHEHFYPAFADAVRWTAEHDRVLDVGTSHKFRKELEPFRSLFGSGYVALDYGARPVFGDLNVDLDADVHRLPFRDAVFDAVICLEVLEHLQRPQDAVDEIGRVLTPGGRLLLTTPFMFGYHAKGGDYEDFYRYTEAALTWLLRDFNSVEVRPLGGVLYRFLLGYVPPRWHAWIVSTALPRAIFNAVDRRLPTSSPARWLVRAVK